MCIRDRHPKAQYLKIAEIVQETHDAKSFILVPDTEAGTTQLAPFKAGSYINLRTELAGSVARRTYSLSSSPKEALAGKYRVTVKLKEGGFLSVWLHNEAKVGDKLTATEPGGHITHSGIRDCKHVVALAGGSGICLLYTSSMSAAAAAWAARASLDLPSAVSREMSRSTPAPSVAAKRYAPAQPSKFRRSAALSMRTLPISTAPPAGKLSSMSRWALLGSAASRTFCSACSIISSAAPSGRAPFL